MIIKPTVIIQSATVEMDAQQLQELAASANALDVLTSAYVEAGATSDNGHTVRADSAGDERLALVQALQPLRKLAEGARDLLAAPRTGTPTRRGGRRKNPTSGG